MLLASSGSVIVCATMLSLVPLLASTNVPRPPPPALRPPSRSVAGMERSGVVLASASAPLAASALATTALAASAASASVDHSIAAASFFNNLRVPAALVAAATIKEAFVLQSASEEIRYSAGWTLLRQTYVLLLMLAFCAEVSCVFVCTYSIVQLQAASMDTTATSVIALLLRELEYEYVAARCHFVTGVHAFVVGQALRVRLVLRKHTNFSKMAMLLVLQTSLTLLAYNNGHSNNSTIPYGGYAGISRRFVVLNACMLIARVRAHHPLAVLAVATWVLTAGFIARMLLSVAAHTTDTPQARGARGDGAEGGGSSGGGTSSSGDSGGGGGGKMSVRSSGGMARRGGRMRSVSEISSQLGGLAFDCCAAVLPFLSERQPRSRNNAE